MQGFPLTWRKINTKKQVQLFENTKPSYWFPSLTWLAFAIAWTRSSFFLHWSCTFVLWSIGILHLYIYTLVLNNGSWHLKLGFAALGDKDDLVLLSLPSEGLENLGGLTLTRQLKVFHNVKGTIFCCRYSLIFQWQTKRQRDCNRIIWFLLLLFYLHLSHLEATPIAHEAFKQIFAPLSHATLTSLPLSLLL